MKSRAVRFLEHPDHRNALLIAVGAMALYLWGLMPTVGWGDGALYQYNAERLVLGASALSHPLYILIARLFLLIPAGEPAMRVALVSAVFASLTAAGMYLVLKQLVVHRTAAVFAVLALLFSHTFWFHAEIPEVYTLNTFFVSIMLYCGVTYFFLRLKKLLFLYSFVMGLALTDHLLAVLGLLPLLFLLILKTPQEAEDDRLYTRPSAGTVLGCGGYFLIGYSLYLFLAFYEGLSPEQFLSSTAGGGFLDYWWGQAVSVGAGLVRFVFFLFYQFPIVGFALMIYGMISFKKKLPQLFVWTLLWFLVNLVLVAGYSVKDQFVFYLPSYLVAVVWMGMGIDKLFHLSEESLEIKPLTIGLLCVSLILLPVVLYSSAPWILMNVRDKLFLLDVKEHGGDLPLLRAIPGRDDASYFLWPPKRTAGARETAEAYLRDAEANAVILADWTLWAPVHYLQKIEGQRGDVEVVMIPKGGQLEFVKEAIAERPVYLMTIEEAYYDVEELMASYMILPEGELFRIVPSGEQTQGETNAPNE